MGTLNPDSPLSEDEIAELLELLLLTGNVFRAINEFSVRHPKISPAVAYQALEASGKC